MAIISFDFIHLIAASYLAADISSAGAGANGYDWKLMDSLSLDKLWDIYGTALNYTRSTSYYSQFVKGSGNCTVSKTCISQKTMLKYSLPG
jgi:hypothetical protein